MDLVPESKTNKLNLGTGPTEFSFLTEEDLLQWGFVKTDSALFPMEKVIQAEGIKDPRDDKLAFVVDMSRFGAICLRTGYGDSIELGGLSSKSELQIIEKCITASFPNW